MAQEEREVIKPGDKVRVLSGLRAGEVGTVESIHRLRSGVLVWVVFPDRRADGFDLKQIERVGDD